MRKITTYHSVVSPKVTRFLDLRLRIPNDYGTGISDSIIIFSALCFYFFPINACLFAPISSISVISAISSTILDISTLSIILTFLRDYRCRSDFLIFIEICSS
jgi:hypothetical protein